MPLAEGGGDFDSDPGAITGAAAVSCGRIRDAQALLGKASADPRRQVAPLQSSSRLGNCGVVGAEEAPRRAGLRPPQQDTRDDSSRSVGGWRALCNRIDSTSHLTQRYSWVVVPCFGSHGNSPVRIHSADWTDLSNHFGRKTGDPKGIVALDLRRWRP